MHIVQVLPELNQGGVERGTVEMNRELVKRGHISTVISAGGVLAEQIEKDGGRHITLDVCSKNPFTVPLRVAKLRKVFRELKQTSGVRGQGSERRSQRSEKERRKAEGEDQKPEVRGQHTDNSDSPATSNQQPATSPHSPPATRRPPPLILHARSRVPAWLTWFANKRLHLPFVTTVHGFNSVGKYSEIMTKGDRVIYSSSAIKEYILKNYNANPDILRHVPRGIDMELFDPQKVNAAFLEEFRKKHGLEGKTVVTLVGRITECKGHDCLIRALAAVQKQHPEVVGLVAGGVRHDKQDYFQTLEKLAVETGADIRFTGSQSEVREIYALSDLVISATSTKAETFGRTAAEALAMNTPVIASAHGGSLDILIDGENGLFFEPGNAEDLAEKIEQALARTFHNMRNCIHSNFSLDHMVETELNVYKELMEKR